jgi:putative FmdB family regulatory protein
MPIYEFHCKDCASDFSSLRQLSQAESVACPNCGATRVSRLLSVTARSQPESDFGQSCETMSPGPCMRPGGCGCRN